MQCVGALVREMSLCKGYVLMHVLVLANARYKI